MTPEILARLLEAKRTGQAAVLATRLSDGLQHVFPDASGATAVADAAGRALREDRNSAVTIDGEPWFLLVHNTPLRLVVVGAVHIAQALVPLASRLAFSITVVDPRRSFATDARFPGVTISTDWPDDAMDALVPDRRMAVVTLTHDPKLDDPALDRALRSDAFYIGALGSRKTHAARLGRLRALGHGEAALARIRGPVGLPIAAITAPEIALAILAEIVAVRRGAALFGKQPAA